MGSKGAKSATKQKKDLRKLYDLDTNLGRVGLAEANTRGGMYGDLAKRRMDMYEHRRRLGRGSMSPREDIYSKLLNAAGSAGIGLNELGVFDLMSKNSGIQGQQMRMRGPSQAPQMTAF